MNNLIMLGAGVVSALGFVADEKQKYDVSTQAMSQLDELANEKFGDDIRTANDLVEKAQKKLDIFNRAEQREMKNRLDLSDEFKVASANASAAKAKMDILKQAIKNTEGDKAAVSVGSGDSAIAVSVSNTGAKAKLEADLAEATAQHKANVDICNRIKSRIAESVRGDRGAEYFAAEQELKEAKETVNIVEGYVKQYKMELGRNDKYRLKALVDNASEAKIVGAAVAKSVLPAAALYFIWKDALANLDVLKHAKDIIS